MSKEIKIVKHDSAAKSEPRTSRYWWEQSEKEIAASVFAVISDTDTHQSARHRRNIINARLYGDLEVLGSFRSQNNISHNQISDRRTYNVIKSSIDTIASKIAKSKPKPQFLTDDGDWKQRKRAKNLTKYVEGVFYDTDLYTKAQKMFVDGCIFGTGAIKIMTKNGRIEAERVIIDELIVDDNDGMYGTPRAIYQTKWVAKDVLIKQFPDSKIAIEANTDLLKDYNGVTIEMIRVIEAWYLASKSGEKDGKHVITIDNATLFTEEYTKTYHPFVFYRWTDKTTGFFGEGISEMLTDTQGAINRLLRRIEKAQDLIAVPRIFVESAADLPAPKINNLIGSIVKLPPGSKPPVFHTATAMNAEVYRHLQWLIDSSFQIVGVSQLSSGAQKPSGLDSGTALRTFQDIESERFMLTAQRYEKMFLDASDIIVDMSRDLYESDKSLSVKVVGGSFISTIKWKDVNLRDEQFIMKTFPTSLLPSTPAGKLQMVQELIQSGLMNKETALSMLDFPDVESWRSLQVAGKEVIEKTLNKMIDSKNYLEPDIKMNLEQAIQLADQYYLDGRVDDLDQEILDLLLRFSAEAAVLLTVKTDQTQPEQVLTPEVTPLGVPEAPESSDLIPLETTVE